MKKAKLALIAAATAVVATTWGEKRPWDAGTKRDIIEFVTLPGRLCGVAVRDFGDMLEKRKLTDHVWFDGDTNHLNQLLCELALTNNVRLASLVFTELGKYGTAEQLPFLYSCATNPAVGNRAVETALCIEGVTSNTLAMAQTYLFQTNRLPYSKIGARADVCHALLDRVYADPALAGYRPAVLDMVQSFEATANVTPNTLDMALVEVDPTYRHSKRRLAILRAASQVQDAEFQYITTCTNAADVEGRIYTHTGQTNYLANAIRELVAYPEADLPD